MAARDVKRSKEYWAMLNAAADRQASGAPFDKTAANAFSDWLAEYSPGDARHVLLANATAHSPVQGGAPREHPTLGRALQGDDLGAVITDPGHRDYRTGNTIAPNTLVNGFGPIASHEGEVRLLNHTRTTAGWRTDSAPVLWWRAKIPAAASTLKREANDATRSSVLAGPVGTSLARSVDFTAPVSAETLHGYIAAMPKSSTRARWLAAANAMYGRHVPLSTAASEATRKANDIGDTNPTWLEYSRVAGVHARRAEGSARDGSFGDARRNHEQATEYHAALSHNLPNKDEGALHAIAADAHRAAAESYTKRKLERDPRLLSYERERLARVSWPEMTRDDLESRHPLAKPTIGGLKILSHTPNLSSLDSTYDSHQLLDGVRSVPVADLDTPSHPDQAFGSHDDKVHAAKLAQAITRSGRIKPLVVSIDCSGAYVLEGLHRFVALAHHLGMTHIPARVAVGSDRAEKLARVRYNSQASGVSEKLSDNHAARISLAKRILRETGLRATVRSVLSHTDERGVRPGVAALVHADAPDDILHYATAWLGMLTGERRMTTFKPGVGSDSLHIITTPRSQADTGEYLKRLGAQFTLDTSGKGTRALLVNPTIDTSAASSGLQGSRQILPGTAKMLGSGDEGESRARYRNIISAAEQRARVTAGPTSPL